MSTVTPPAARFAYTAKRTRERRHRQMGCRWAVLHRDGLPRGLERLAGAASLPWIPVRADRAGRFLAPAGRACATLEAARKECLLDAAFLRGTEQEIWQATGRAPLPLRAAVMYSGGRRLPDVAMRAGWHRRAAQRRPWKPAWYRARMQAQAGP